MQFIDYDNEVQYFENYQEVKLSFPRSIDPQIIIDKLDKYQKDAYKKR